jgi:hypothetical protein
VVCGRLAGGFLRRQSFGAFFRAAGKPELQTERTACAVGAPSTAGRDARRYTVGEADETLAPRRSLGRQDACPTLGRCHRDGFIHRWQIRLLRPGTGRGPVAECATTDLPGTVVVRYETDNALRTLASGGPRTWR